MFLFLIYLKIGINKFLKMKIKKKIIKKIIVNIFDYKIIYKYYKKKNFKKIYIIYNLKIYIFSN